MNQRFIMYAVPDAPSPSDNWNRESHKMTKNEFGVYEITIPAVQGQPAIPHNSKVKVRCRALDDRSGTYVDDAPVRSL